MTYKYGDWYCKPANKTEAEEIVARAVASGAVDRNRNWAFTARFYGVYNGVVKTYSVGTKYTIGQLREMFPLPCEQSKEWDGEGLPLAGTVCYIQLAFNDMGKCEITYMGDGVYCYRQLSTKREYTGSVYDTVFRRIRSERDMWIEDALNILQRDPASMPAQFMGMLYDALRSGDLKAPEVE